MVVKEFIQMRRDRVTFGMMIGIPLLQLILFGFAINSDPKHLPTAVLSADQGIFSRTLLFALKNSDYFRFVCEVKSEAEAQKLLDGGEVQFVVNIPENFSRKLMRGERPTVLLEADATDPVATGNAISAISTLISYAVDRDLKGNLQRLKATPGPVDLRLHRKYNPEGITRFNIVPGLMGVVLTMTMVNLLATPARPFEVMLGKIVPYILVGYIQITLILLAAKLLFQVPIVGNPVLLYAVALVFITANLSVGITFSTLGQNQLQAVQMAFFFFLPSLLLSGFMFPFRGMPEWAQAIGSVLPLTHFLRIVRGILLKGNGLMDILPHLWPLAAFMAVALTIGVKRYRQTLD
jgi:ABC-2 type transport system permease protein